MASEKKAKDGIPEKPTGVHEETEHGWEILPCTAKQAKSYGEAKKS